MAVGLGQVKVQLNLTGFWGEAGFWKDLTGVGLVFRGQVSRFRGLPGVGPALRGPVSSRILLAFIGDATGLDGKDARFLRVI